MSCIKQIWDFFPVIQKNIKDSEAVYMDSWGRDPNLWASVYVTVVIDLFKKDYVVGIYIQFIYRHFLSVRQKIPNHVMKHIKFKPTLVNLLPCL